VSLGLAYLGLPVPSRSGLTSETVNLARYALQRMKLSFTTPCRFKRRTENNMKIARFLMALLLLAFSASVQTRQTQQPSQSPPCITPCSTRSR